MMGPLALARAVNAEPWEPPRGMEKRRCPTCHYLFAAALARSEPRCPTCVDRGRFPPDALPEPQP